MRGLDFGGRVCRVGGFLFVRRVNVLFAGRGRVGAFRRVYLYAGV
jgi:hypothetical protein